MSEKKRPRFRHHKGRPPALTEERKRTILTAIRAGNYPLTAAIFSGISETTWYKYQQRAAAGDPEFAEFAEAVKKATAQAEVHRLSIIGMAAKGCPAKYATNREGELERDKQGNPVKLESEVFPQWTAAAWALERMSKEKFGRFIEQSVKGSGPGGSHLVATVDLNWDKLSDAELRQLKALAVKVIPADVIDVGAEEAEREETVADVKASLRPS